MPCSAQGRTRLLDGQRLASAGPWLSEPCGDARPTLLTHLPPTPSAMEAGSSSTYAYITAKDPWGQTYSTNTLPKGNNGACLKGPLQVRTRACPRCSPLSRNRCVTSFGSGDRS